MKEYLFKGRVELGGVTFIVTAENKEDAIAKAKSGDWDDYETDAAECINADVDVRTVKLNE